MLVLAEVSPVTTAIISAAAGLLGVLVGGATKYLADGRLAESKEKADAVAGARLVRDDLARAATAMETTWNVSRVDERRRRILNAVGPEVPLTAWEEHRAALARKLDGSAWDRVVIGVQMVRTWNALMEAHDGDEAVAKEGASGEMRGPLYGAINTLSQFAGLRPIKPGIPLPPD